MTNNTEENVDRLAAFVRDGLTRGFLRAHLTTDSAPPELEITDAVAYKTNNPFRNQKASTITSPPIEVARDAVRHNLHKLQQTFDVLEARLAPGSALKASLRTLEDEAARYEYEMLSRVAAILHDTLRYNPIEDFDEAQFQGFVEACKQAVEGQADQSDPYACELAMFRVGLSWLPVITEVFMTDEEENPREA